MSLIFLDFHIGSVLTPCFSKDFDHLGSRGARSGLGRGESLAALVARFDKVVLLSKAIVFLFVNIFSVPNLRF